MGLLLRDNYRFVNLLVSPVAGACVTAGFFKASEPAIGIVLLKRLVASCGNLTAVTALRRVHRPPGGEGLVSALLDARTLLMGHGS